MQSVYVAHIVFVAHSRFYIAHICEIAETELLGLHEGNFARYQIRPSEFAAWQTAWSGQ